MKLFLFWTIISWVYSATPVVWNQDPAVQTGQYEAMTGSVVNGTIVSAIAYQPAYTYTVPFSNAVTNYPTSAMGINSLQFNNQVDVLIFFNLYVSGISLSSIDVVTRYNGTNSIVKVRISVIICDQNVNTFLKLRIISWVPTNPAIFNNFIGLNSGSGYRVIELTVSRATPIDVTHVNYQLPFIKSFILQSSSTDSRLELGIRFNNINSTHYNVTFWSSGDCLVYYSEYFSITFDQTIVQESQSTFTDAGYITGKDGVQLNSTVIQHQIPNNFIIGVNYFRLDFGSSQKSFKVDITYPNNITTSTNYSIVNMTYFNYRVRYCPPAQPLYNKPDQMCYNTCPSGTYRKNSTVTFCTNCHNNCLLCNVEPTCSSCNSSHNRELNSTNYCTCKKGYFENNTQVCPKCVDTKCLECSSETVCTVCNTSDGVYLNSGTCSPCPSNCLKCANAADCLQCEPVGYYLETVTKKCWQCHYSCLTCSHMNSTACLTCPSTGDRYYDVVYNSCPCPPKFLDLGFYYCTPCGTKCLNCNILGCMICETGYIKDTSNSSNCIRDSTYVQPEEPVPPNANFTFQVLQILKQPTANNLTYTIKIQSMPTILIGTDLTQIFNFDLPPNSSVEIQYDSKTGILIAKAAYASSIQSTHVNVKLNSKKSGLIEFLNARQIVKSIRVLSSNNMAANYYEPVVYDKLKSLDGFVKAVVALSLITLVLGSYTGKLVATQMIGVIQLTAIGLTLIHYATPLLYSFKSLKYTHGYNPSTNVYQEGLPVQLTWMDYSNTLSNNINLMMLFALIALLVSLAFFIVSKFIPQQNQKQRFWNYFNLSIGEYLLVALMFCQYQFFLSLPIFLQYPKQGGKMLVGSIFIIILYLTAIGFSMALFILKDGLYFGQFKKYFHPDKFCQLYYLIPMSERILIGIIFGAVRDPYAAGIIAIVILSAEAIIIAIKRPYIEQRQNIRSLINYVVSIVIIAIFIAICDQTTQQFDIMQSSLYVPYAIIILLFVVMCMSLGFIIFNTVIKIKQLLNRPKEQRTANLFTTQTNEKQPNLQQLSNEPKQTHQVQISINDNSKDIEVEISKESQVQIHFEMPKARRKRRKNISANQEYDDNINKTTEKLHFENDQNIEAVFQF